jgi:hypothetical protein
MIRIIRFRLSLVWHSYPQKEEDKIGAICLDRINSILDKKKDQLRRGGCQILGVNSKKWLITGG